MEVICLCTSTQPTEREKQLLSYQTSFDKMESHSWPFFRPHKNTVEKKKIIDFAIINFYCIKDSTLSTNSSYAISTFAYLVEIYDK